MRTFISFLVGLLTAAVVVGLGVLVSQNGQDEQLSALGMSFQAEKGWIVAGAAALGFLLAVLVLIPGRLATSWQSWARRQQAQELANRLQALREQYAELQGRHRHLVAEHQYVLAHMLNPAAAGREQSSSAAPAAANGSATPDGRKPALRTRLIRQESGVDRLRARINARRAAKHAEGKGSTADDGTGNTSDQEQPQREPTAAAV